MSGLVASGVINPVEIGRLLSFGREPIEIRAREHCIEQHQTLDSPARRHWPAVAALRFADRAIEAFAMNVIHPRAIVPAAAGDGAPAFDQLVEESVTLLAPVGE